MDKKNRLAGIDLGGTKIEAALLDATHQIIWRERVPTPGGDYGATLNAIQGLLNRLERETGFSGPLGLATPGSVSRQSGRMKNCNSTCLNDRSLREDLQTLLGQEVRIANDADCLALSETVDGAASGANSVFAAILGTGVGAGITVHGNILFGPNGIAGEWGHNPLPEHLRGDEPARACYCGRRDCIETFVSGPGLERSWVQRGMAPIAGPEIVLRADAGHTVAREVLDTYFDQLAGALAVVLNILDPEIVVFGGGLSALPRICEQVQSRWAPHVFSDSVETRLAVASHGDSSGVRGAAWLWKTEPPVRQSGK